MQIHLIAVGTRMPAWVMSGYGEYVRRMPHECNLRLVEIPLSKRRKTQSALKNRQEEGKAMLAALPEQATVVALDVRGKAWSTETLAARLQDWLQAGRDIALLVGGPDGLAEECVARADMRWSLSPLTLPHALVRVLLAEQLYRAWSVIQGHPYHRG
jgi:23S rRNA (pseudouridine1915-N3)-methyltransferase